MMFSPGFSSSAGGTFLCVLTIARSYGEKGRADAFLRDFQEIVDTAGGIFDGFPIRLDIGRHFEDPGRVDLFKVTGSHQGRKRRGYEEYFSLKKGDPDKAGVKTFQMFDDTEGYGSVSVFPSGRLSRQNMYATYNLHKLTIYPELVHTAKVSVLW